MRWYWPALAALAMTAAAGASTPPNFEVRLIVACQPGDAGLVLIGSNEELCLAKDKVFDAAGVVKVQRYPTVPKAVMVISQPASDRLYDMSFDKTSERLGFVFNGRLIFAPVIFQPIKTTELYLTLKNDPDDIDALVAAFPGDVAAK